MKQNSENPVWACMFLGIITLIAVMFFGGIVYDESIMLSFRGVLALGLVGVSILYGMELGHRIADMVYAVCMCPLVLYPLFDGDVKGFILNVVGIFALMIGFYIFFRCNPICRNTLEKWVFGIVAEEK